MYKTKRRYQGEPIRTDPTCDPKENETAIHFNAGDRNAWISSYDASVVAGLLAHPDFKIEELALMRLERVDSVVGVVGKIPVAALRIGPSRETSTHAQIVPPIRKNSQPTDRAREISAKRVSTVKLRKAKSKALSQSKPKQKPAPGAKRRKRAVSKRRVASQPLPLTLRSKVNAGRSKQHSRNAPRGKQKLKAVAVSRRVKARERQRSRPERVPKQRS